MANRISLYQNLFNVAPILDLDITLFLEQVKNGHWAKETEAYRKLTTVEEKRKRKKELPVVTPSGLFLKRAVSGLKEHSGFICIDVDDRNPDEVKELVKNDKYLFAAFKSISGNGVALLFKINPAKHLEAFLGLSEYLFLTYGLMIDQACKDISRGRTITHDPDLILNKDAVKFAIYVKPPSLKVTKPAPIVFVKSDFEEIMARIQSGRIDLCPTYSDWLNIAFAISSHFGEAGRDYFHIVSANSEKYNVQQTDKQYTVCVKRGGTGIGIGTFYYMCQQAGIETYSTKTYEIANTVSLAMLSGKNLDAAIKIAQKKTKNYSNDVDQIAKQVYDYKIVMPAKNSDIEQLEEWIRINYSLRRNSITRKIEQEGKVWEEYDINSAFIAAKKLFPKLDFNLMLRLLYSDFVETYNPFLDFIEKYKDRNSKGNIEKLANCIQTDMPSHYVTFFITKWLIGIIESMHGGFSSLMLVLSGVEQNTGKTTFFRKLLPDELLPYKGESKLDAGTDDEILMCQKLLILDDEMGGKSKKDARRLKELTSKDIFSLREPYGRSNVDLKRIAVLCGTTNEDDILNDITGNRRIIPVRVNAISHALYNSIDKIDLLMEAFSIWQKGGVSALTKADIDFLNQHTTDFEKVSIERELILKFFKQPIEGAPELTSYFTASEIKIEIEKYTQQRLSLDKVGKEMVALGFEKKSIKTNQIPLKKYIVVKVLAVENKEANIF